METIIIALFALFVGHMGAQGEIETIKLEAQQTCIASINSNTNQINNLK